MEQQFTELLTETTKDLEAHKEKDNAEALVPVDQTVPKEAMMRVGDLMAQQVTTLAPTSPVQEAISLLADRRFRHILIAESDGRLAGVLSDRDVFRCLARHQDATTTTVETIMNRTPIVMRPASSLTDANRILVRHRFNSLPVIDEDNRICGILTTTDLLRLLQAVQAWFEQRVGPGAKSGDA